MICIYIKIKYLIIQVLFGELLDSRIIILSPVVQIKQFKFGIKIKNNKQELYNKKV